MNSQLTKPLRYEPITSPLEVDGPGLRSYLLAELRCGVLRARLCAYEIEAIGLALKYGIITPTQTVVLLDDVGAMGFIGAEKDAA